MIENNKNDNYGIIFSDSVYILYLYLKNGRKKMYIPIKWMKKYKMKLEI